ncbi:hypothetical protein KGM86_06525 [Leuconostoc lactis]|uniref:hypothetical protein n=1 Tax=Leuconostoc lactis TaxID=1246 RepID=UPI001C1F3A45|nr:hypothetical protein [Leuconostoc lactis]MBU7538090.1 hypothetical protein [Leuconostoc lactis]
MTNQLPIVGKSALTILSSTIIVLPFMLLIQLSNGQSLLTVLPFVLFYTFRMTGIFFIRGIKTRLHSLSLLKLALYCGLLGCGFGILGIMYFPSFIVAGFFLGLSGAWLPPANAAIGQYLKTRDAVLRGNLVGSLVMLVLLGAALLLPAEFKYLMFFVIYGVMYGLALQTPNVITHYQVDTDDLAKTSYRYLILFIVFFILLFGLRSSRMLADALAFDAVINSFFFIALLTVGLVTFWRRKVQRNVSNQLLCLTFINGAVGNYLFLFSSLYTAAFYGHREAFFYFYLPYVLGTLLASKGMALLGTDVKRRSLVGIVVGLLIILGTPLFPIGLFIVSLFKGTLNGWLTTSYQATDPIPEDKRLWVKYTLQNIGSILTQFLLMVLASVIILKDGHTIQDFFIMTTASTPTAESIQVMHGWNTVATTLVLAAIVLYGLIFSYQKKTDISKSERS